MQVTPLVPPLVVGQLPPTDADPTLEGAMLKKIKDNADIVGSAAVELIESARKEPHLGQNVDTYA